MAVDELFVSDLASRRSQKMLCGWPFDQSRASSRLSSDC
jgi:hypothetical protein